MRNKQKCEKCGNPIAYKFQIKFLCTAKLCEMCWYLAKLEFKGMKHPPDKNDMKEWLSKKRPKMQAWYLSDSKNTIPKEDE